MRQAARPSPTAPPTIPLDLADPAVAAVLNSLDLAEYLPRFIAADIDTRKLLRRDAATLADLDVAEEDAAKLLQTVGKKPGR